MKDFSYTPLPPTLKLAGLKIWIHDRHSPESEDYWDGNWLNVTANCFASGANVWISSTLVHLSEITYFLTDIEKMHSFSIGTAELSCTEPELVLSLEATTLGQILMVVDITPDSCQQQHQFKFEIDQNSLPDIIQSCREVLQSYPIKNSDLLP
jgi:hypothetical protein